MSKYEYQMLIFIRQQVTLEMAQCLYRKIQGLNYVKKRFEYTISDNVIVIHAKQCNKEALMQYGIDLCESFGVLGQIQIAKLDGNVIVLRKQMKRFYYLRADITMFYPVNAERQLMKMRTMYDMDSGMFFEPPDPYVTQEHEMTMPF